jgi:hypothetical protein
LLVVVLVVVILFANISTTNKLLLSLLVLVLILLFILLIDVDADIASSDSDLAIVSDTDGTTCIDIGIDPSGSDEVTNKSDAEINEGEEEKEVVICTGVEMSC